MSTTTEQIKLPLPPRPQLQKPPGYRNPAPIHRPPPKAVNLPPSFHQNKRPSRPLCCCICIFPLILLLLSASAAGFIYLWFRPHLPNVHLKSIDFAKFNISATSDGPALSAQSNVVVEIKNPNQKLGIEYNWISVSLSAANGINADLGEQTVPGFSQGRDNVTTLKFGMKVQNEIVDDQSAEGLKKGFKSRNLLVNVEIRSRIGVKASGWTTTGFVPVTVMCAGIRLNRVEGGGDMPKCRVELLDWYDYYAD